MTDKQWHYIYAAAKMRDAVLPALSLHHSFWDKCTRADSKLKKDEKDKKKKKPDRIS